MRAYIICIDKKSTQYTYADKTLARSYAGGGAVQLRHLPRFFGTLKIGEPDEIIDGYTEIFCEGHEIAHGRFALTAFP